MNFMSTDSAPVDIRKQTIHAIIPGLDLRAAKRIGKARQITIIGTVIALGIAGFGYGVIIFFDSFNLVSISLLLLILVVLYTPIQAYLIRKWSIEWNKKFE